ncbi:phosphatase PAP2 family protein [Haliangium ochraceum]|uniref:Phosphoesterase PA-phosphatase related protein n=1 Tax=Haliangium ochraceum (strain DSM 14365 / JCM 11303 / SMP-2) TaxID=502025 RepID=D0LXY1_HALO1|nr:phosphatase PAP2 family protein [Haliangium ochraceum]ACY14336.1 phosphoesterase PA-phosphatase related protein [Haliangium ochraceum DSM 14365]
MSERRFGGRFGFGGRLLVLVLGLALGALTASPALAQDEPATDFEVNLAVDGAITGALAAGALLSTLIPVDVERRWTAELFGRLDESVKRQFSDSAAGFSDALLAATVFTPVALQLPGGWNRETGERLLLYGQAVSANLMLNGIAKYVIQRPRPYVYYGHERVEEYATRAGRDSRLSFYSGHASTAFTAAVSGSYLFAAGSADREIKMLTWFIEMSLASATAQLRVRAGKHFYSDVLTGALLGSTIGVLVPLVHAGEDGVYAPSGLEWAAIGGGLVVGTALVYLMPIVDDIRVPLVDIPVQLAPTGDANSAGLSLVGQF